MAPLTTLLAALFAQNFDMEVSNTKPNQFSIVFSEKHHAVWYS